jgi:hypothetical protein
LEIKKNIYILKGSGLLVDLPKRYTKVKWLFTNTNKYSGSTSSVPSLTIFNAASSDAGTYTCFASNSVGTGQSSTTQLSVIVQSKHCWNNYVLMKPKWEQRGFETRLVHL